MRILLIMPNFFNYPDVIIEELTKQGHIVDFFDDRPSTNPIVKSIIRLKKDVINVYIRSYFSKIISFIESKKYDVVFLISGQSLSFDERMVLELKLKQPHAKFVLYQWDSLENFPYIKKMYKYFDKCYTFDPGDAAKNRNLNFLPLFYSKQYKLLPKNITALKYDFCFIGTAHPKKYKFIKEISRTLADVYPNQFIYYYLPSRLVFLYRKILNNEFKIAKYSEFNFTPLDSETTCNIILQSNCILDSPQANQKGLTIRAIEALGARKKLITTNSDIKNYDFYKEENIYIYDGTFDLSSPFFNTGYSEIDSTIYEKYSLENWLKVILRG